MKILYHHRIASQDGQFVHIDELTRALSELGHEIIMVSPPFTQGLAFGSKGGLFAKLKLLLPRAVYELAEFSYSFVAYMKLRRAVRKFSPDCLYERYNLFMPAGAWIKRRYGLPMISEVNAPLFEERSKFDGIALSRLGKWSELYVWNTADAVLPVTRVLADKLRHDGIAAGSLHVIHNGINIDDFENPPDSERVRKSLNIVGKTVLGFTGFMREWHDLLKIVDLVAADKSGDRVALLVGDGPARQGIETYANRLGVSDRVLITGVVSRDEVRHYIAAFDVALQPNVVEYASPLKIFEYMAMGKAIVAPDTENIRECLEDGFNAALFSSKDAAAFGHTVEALLADAARKRDLERQARQSITDLNLTWQNNAVRVTEIIERLLQRRASGAGC